MVTLLLVLELSPLWGPALLAWPAYRWLGFMALAILLAYLVAAAAMAAWMRQRVLAHLLSIVMTFVAAAVMLRAAILGRRRGGAAWRGTIYSTQDLRDGMRVKFL
jgi:hypothetical protein